MRNQSTWMCVSGTVPTGALSTNSSDSAKDSRAIWETTVGYDIPEEISKS